MEIRWLEAALGDLEAAHGYIATDDPAAAAHVYESIIDEVETLAQLPRRGRAGRVGGTRELVIARTPYIVVYQVKAEAVEILRVRHGAQQWPPRV